MFLMEQAVADRGLGGEASMAHTFRSASFLWVASILAVLSAALSLLRGERPRWVAVIGLTLSGLPAVVGLLFFLS